jgi:hypothetical protein
LFAPGQDVIQSRISLMFQLFVIFVFLHVWGVIFDHADNISDLEVIMDSRMVFANHVDIVVGKAWAMLGFVKRISGFLIPLRPFMCQ